MRIESEYQSENQQVLSRRQTNHARRQSSVLEKPASPSPRVVETVFHSRNRIRPLVGYAIFNRACNGLDGLPESRPAAIAVPGNFRPKRHAPRAAHDPVNRHLCGHPKCARAPNSNYFFRSSLIFESYRHWTSLPFRNAIRKETPEFQCGIGLVRAIEDCLLDVHVLRGGVDELPAGTRNIVCMSKMPIAIKDERRCREFSRERITGVHPEHQIRRVVCSPGARILEVIFGVQRIIADEAVEEPRLDRESVAYRRKIGNICQAKVPEPIGATDVGSSGRESKTLRILASVHS